MIATLETKACQACAKAKRRCGKERPQCARCIRRGIECTYPPSKPSCFVLLEEDDSLPLACKDSPYSTSYSSGYTVSSRSGPINNVILPSHRLAFQPYPVAPLETYLSSIWFNLPSTWQITPWPQDGFHSLYGPKVKRLITQIQQWYAQWISTGSNPFIHAQLYRHRLPQCVQDTYTTLSAYLHRTPETEHLVFQIFEARLTQLLADHGVCPCDAEYSVRRQPSTTDLSTPDTLGHLARAQALTTYLLIMLFNGNIRLRSVAEQHIPVLRAWMQQMIEDARSTPSLGYLIDPSHSDSLWHAWVLAESLRRTFLVAGTVIALYEMLMAGKPVSTACKGGIEFTIRRGAWEATSATEWEEMVAEVDLGLMQVGDARRWVQWGGISEGQVDSFARMFLEGTYGDGWS